MTLQDPAWENTLFKMQDRLTNLNVIEYENFIDRVSESTLHLTFKKLPLDKFGVVLKNIQNYLKRLLRLFSLFHLV